MCDEIMQHTACFTGHRPGHGGIRYLPGEKDYDRLTEVLDQAILEMCEQFEVKNFLCGMADGFDLFAAKRVLALRRTGRIPDDVCVIAVQPFPEHLWTIRGDRWQKDYQEVLQCAGDVCVVSKEYTTDAFKRRNAYLVKHSGYVIAFWNGVWRSGTGQTVRMAEEAGKTVINLYGI